MASAPNKADALEQDDSALKESTVEDAVLDETEGEQQPHKRFQITSYGADMTVFELTHRLGKDFIVPPAFQRKYVWSKRQASRFIESLLMGLPVPGIFLYKDQKLKKQLLVDGLQRLETLARFKNKTFEGKLFELTEVAEPWDGKTWDDLTGDDKDIIEQSVIHATIFQQDYPKEKDRSIYEVFERINTGGLRLSYQEIRACVSFGSFSKLLRDLNTDTDWRKIFGEPSNRLKDEELILRFFALTHKGNAYTKPMREFLDNFLEDNREFEIYTKDNLTKDFSNAIAIAHGSLGERAFRVGPSLNAAIFDSVMVAIAARLKRGPIVKLDTLKQRYSELLQDTDYQAAYVRATSDEDSVRTRLRIATKWLADVP
jgi:hypothetical protein